MSSMISSAIITAAFTAPNHAPVLKLYEQTPFKHMMIEATAPKYWTIQPSKRISAIREYGRQTVVIHYNAFDEIDYRKITDFGPSAVTVTTIDYGMKSYSVHYIDYSALQSAAKAMAPEQLSIIQQNLLRGEQAQELQIHSHEHNILLPDFAVNGHSCWLESGRDGELFRCLVHRDLDRASEAFAILSSEWKTIRYDTTTPPDPALFDTSVPVGFEAETETKEETAALNGELLEQLLDSNAINQMWQTAMQSAEKDRDLANTLLHEAIVASRKLNHSK